MDLTKQRQALLDLKRQYSELDAATELRDRSESAAEDSPVDSDIPTHNADAATVTFERTRDDAFKTEYHEILGKIGKALAKIDDGTYGVCEVCGKRIPDGRLEAEPYAVLCIDDQEQAESFGSYHEG